MQQTRGLDQIDIEAAREGMATYQLKELRPEGIKPRKLRGLSNCRVRTSSAEHLLPMKK